jgi:hypothetical protein
MTAKKSTSSEKTKKSPAKKAAPAKQAAKKAPAKKAAAKPAAKTGVSSLDVTLGHIFALRPRADRSFRQAHLPGAKRALEKESYKDLNEAARAVVEEALSITRKGAFGPERKRR